MMGTEIVASNGQFREAWKLCPQVSRQVRFFDRDGSIFTNDLPNDSASASSGKCDTNEMTNAESKTRGAETE
jgi:hypothetical protein